MQPHWGTYFTVKDVDETAREAVELGGKICVPPQDIPGVGRFCGITSPQGVTFYVIKYSTVSPVRRMQSDDRSADFTAARAAGP